MRPSCDVASHLDLGRALKGGMLCFKFANEVILALGFNGVIAAEYSCLVEIIATQEVLYGPTM